MICNKLSVNPVKTEYLPCISKYINVPVTVNLNLKIIWPSDSAKNLGLIVLSDISINERISSFVKTYFSLTL